MKKMIKAWWAALFHRPKYIVAEVDKTNALHVVEIERDGDLLSGLGMTKERAEELENLAEKVYNESNNVVEVMEKVSKHCKHANELYFVSMVITTEHNRGMSMKNHPLMMILGGGPPRPGRPDKE